MKFISIIIVSCFLALAACDSNGLGIVKPSVDVELTNRSSKDLENTQARFGENVCKWGWSVKSATKSYMDYPYPITADAELHWDVEGRHRVEKIDLSKVYPRGKSGRLAFTIYDDRVEVNFRPRT